MTKAKKDSRKPAEETGVDLRNRLLSIAERLLQDKGPDNFSIRELARLGDISTMGIYTAFGGRIGVMDALYEAGFARLYEWEKSVENPDDPYQWLIDKLYIYRKFALENVGLYRLMFGGARRFQPAPASTQYSSLVVPVESAYPAFNALVATLAACKEAGLLADEREPDEIAFSTWATLHGLVSLEIAGYVDEDLAKTRFDSGVETILRGMLKPGLRTKMSEGSDPE